MTITPRQLSKKEYKMRFAKHMHMVTDLCIETCNDLADKSLSDGLATDDPEEDAEAMDVPGAHK
jgi:hypothetical protein